jgi:hypothetical protein
MLNFLNRWKEPPPTKPSNKTETLPGSDAGHKVTPEPAPVESAHAKIARHLNQYGENIEAHDSTLFEAPIVEATFYDGRRIRIPQQSTPDGWMTQF